MEASNASSVEGRYDSRLIESLAALLPLLIILLISDNFILATKV